jgi:outer membrane protein insertion porin family
VDGALLNASISERNLFGSGKELTASFDNSSSTTNFNISYVNPYHTGDGISRGFNVFSSEVDAAQADTAAYNTKTIGAGVFYGIPISEQRKIDLGIAYERLELEVGPFSAQVAQDFVALNGTDNDTIKATIGWSHDTLDSFLFPSSGGLQRAVAEIAVPGSDLEYYKLTYSLGRYFPLSKRYVFKAKGKLGFGDGYGDTTELPFYKNFFAGGSSTVRGYNSRSLGPRDSFPPNDPIGGSKRALVNLELLFPLPGSSPEKKSMRLSLFVDGGMVYGADEKMDLGELRYSTGLAFNWFTPVGPLSLSFAKALNDKPDDDTEALQFTLGVPFR